MLRRIGDAEPERHQIEERRVGDFQSSAGEERARVKDGLIHASVERCLNDGVGQRTVRPQKPTRDEMGFMKNLDFHAGGGFSAAGIHHM